MKRVYIRVYTFASRPRFNAAVGTISVKIYTRGGQARDLFKILSPPAADEYKTARRRSVFLNARASSRYFIFHVARRRPRRIAYCETQCFYSF